MTYSERAQKKSKLILVISANQKHYPDLGHVTLHQKEISDVILLETDGGFAKCRLFSEAKKRTQASYLKKLFSSWTFRQLCEKKLLQLICIKKKRENGLDKSAKILRFNVLRRGISLTLELTNMTLSKIVRTRFLQCFFFTLTKHPNY